MSSEHANACEIYRPSSFLPFSVPFNGCRILSKISTTKKINNFFFLCPIMYVKMCGLLYAVNRLQMKFPNLWNEILWLCLYMHECSVKRTEHRNVNKKADAKAKPCSTHISIHLTFRKLGFSCSFSLVRTCNGIFYMNKNIS